MIKKIWQKQEIRFLFVGGLNTLVGYGIYAILLFLIVNYLIANTISTVLGVLHSYLWNRFFTFKSKEKAGKELLKFVLVYIISYLIGMVSLYCFTGLLKLSPYIAGLINLIFTTLISWFGHKYFSFNSNLDKKRLFFKFSFVFLIIFIGFLFLTALYGDILITTNASIVFDDLLFKGDLYNFYKATYQTFGGALEGAYITYDFPIYIFFGLWNLPLYIVTKIWNINWIESLPCLLYAKSFLIVLTILCLFVMKKILKIFSLTKDDQKMYNFLFISSAIVIMVISMFGGYEILSILFTLIGLYFYLKDDLKKFTLFFAIAISLKLFALFIFLPLLILKEKKIWKIIAYSLFSISLVILPKLIYWHAPLYYESMHQFEENMFSKISKSYFLGPFGPVSIFVLLYTLFCFWCYYKKIHNKKILNLYAMYIPLVVFGFFILFGEIHPQWSILLIPYMVFFLVYNKEERSINIILESVFSVSLMLVLYIIYTWVFSPGLFSFLTLGKFYPQTNGITGLNILNYLDVGQYLPIISGIMIASFLYFLWINRPEKISNNKIDDWKYSWLFLRMCIMVPFVVIILFYYFK